MRRRSVRCLAVGALLLGACAGEPAVDDDEVVDDEVADDAVEGDVFTEPRDFIGTSVEVAGEVSEVITPTAFRLDGPGAGGTLLVLSTVKSEAPVDEVVKVTGEVEELDVLRVEEELGRDLDDEVFGPLEGEPVILAESVDP